MRLSQTSKLIFEAFSYIIARFFASAVVHFQAEN
jgi:hypothetical protein